MTERRKARRYDLSLSVTVSSDSGKDAVQKGTTRDVSTRGVYVVWIIRSRRRASN